MEQSREGWAASVRVAQEGSRDQGASPGPAVSASPANIMASTRQHMPGLMAQWVLLQGSEGLTTPSCPDRKARCCMPGVSHLQPSQATGQGEAPAGTGTGFRCCHARQGAVPHTALSDRDGCHPLPCHARTGVTHCRAKQGWDAVPGRNGCQLLPCQAGAADSHGSAAHRLLSAS